MKVSQSWTGFKKNTGMLALRHATVIDCLPTTHFDIITKDVRDTGIDEEAFIRHYQNGSAEEALNEDLDFAGRLGIHSLPAYLIQYEDKALLIQSFDYKDFINAIDKLTANTLSAFRLLPTLKVRSFRRVR